MLVSVLTRGWQVAVASVAYRALGFGSHHWEVIDAAGTRWFATADELVTKQHSSGESLSAAFGRLRASLAAARDLRDCGAAFVVAPVPTLDGEPLVRANEQFAVALYPFAKCLGLAWGEFPTPAHQCAVLDLIVAVHAAPATARRHALADDFVVPHRDELEATLLAGWLGQLGQLGQLGRRDRQGVRSVRSSCRAPASRTCWRGPAAARSIRRPCCADTIPARWNGPDARGTAPWQHDADPAGWLLIDWDTALIAPPERDPWSLDPGDGSILGAYADATGVTPLPSILELYRIRWDLADMAGCVSRFRQAHAGSRDDDMSCEVLRSLVERIDA